MESLYTDQLKPASRTLRRRIGEQASGLTIEQLYRSPDGAFQQLPNIDLAHLQTLCAGCSCIQVQIEEGGDWSAVLNDRPQAFVDIYNPKDSFPAGFWQTASKYFDGLSGSTMFFPGNRYACAQALVGRKLEFLFKYTLGQVCHMVEIAISRRKLLGYCNDTIVPYNHSLSMRKEQCAKQQRRCVPVSSVTVSSDGDCQASPVLPPATLEIARRNLREILQANTVVPLSNIKRIFRTHYHSELSETLLGHSRLSDLLQDRRFQDLCTVRLQRNGYVVVAQPGLQQAPTLAIGQGFGRIAEEAPRLELAASLPTPVTSPVAGLPTPSPSPGVPQSARVRKWSSWLTNFQKEAAASYQQQLQLGPDESLRGGHLASSISLAPQCRPQYGRDECRGRGLEPAGVEAVVDTEAVTISLSLPTPLPSPGVPTSATRRGWSDKPRRTEFCKDEPLCLVPTPLASPGVPGSAMIRKWAELSQSPSLTRGDSSDSTVSGDTLVSMVSFPWEASGISTAQSLLAESSSDSLQLFDGSEQLVDVTGLSEPLSGSEEQPNAEHVPRTPRWPIADVTNLQTTSKPCNADKASAPTLTFGKWKEMVVVQNTFIHAKMPPPTPLDHGRRSSSVPKDAGSSTGDASTPLPDIRASEQQCNSGRWNPKIDRSSAGDATISPGQDDDGLRLHPRFSLQLDKESQTLGLEVDSSPKKEMVSPTVPLHLQPTSLSAQAGRLGLTIQNTFVHTASVPLTPSTNTEKRSSSTPPVMSRTAASGCCFGDQLQPLSSVSSVSRTPPKSGCEAIAQTAEEEAAAVNDNVNTAPAIHGDAASAKADADTPRSPPPRRNVRSKKLLELMPPCCRTFFHTATAPESTLKAA